MATSKFVSGIVENVGSTQITITEDKLRNKLLKHVPRLRKSREWIGALLTTGSLAATIYTCTFTTKLGLSAELWEAIFIVLMAVGLIIFCYNVINAINNRSDEERIISDIMNVDGNKVVKQHTVYGLKIEHGRICAFKEIKAPSDKDDKSEKK